jgi:hypothetical protein
VKAAHVHDSAPTTVGSVCQISQADNIEYVPGKTIRSLVMLGFPRMPIVCWPYQAGRLHGNAKKSAALPVADTEVLGTARCDATFNDVLYNLDPVGSLSK